jgi:WW domain
MLPPNWTKYTTEDGKDYYHNHVTNQTQWDFPMQPAEPLVVKTLQLSPSNEGKIRATSAEPAVMSTAETKKSTYGVQVSQAQPLFGTALPCSWCLPSMEFLNRGFNVTTATVSSRVTACCIPIM